MRLALACLLAACGTAGPPRPSAQADHVGWLGVAPADTADDQLPAWLPVDPEATVLVPGSLDGVAVGAELVVVPAEGGPVAVRHAGKGTLAYGCDGGTLEVTRLAGARRLAPGVVWVLRPPLPSGWRPAGIPLVDTEPTESRREWRAGSLRLTLERRDATHAVLRMTAGGKDAGELGAEKHFMEGAEEAGIDLTREGEIGMPMPAAAFRLRADGGEALVALTIRGYEGVTLEAALLPHAGGEQRRPRGAYLYQCAS